jgi:signal transduction histidine kinase
MHERMTAAGGKLEIESELDGGTRVTAAIPERTGR